MIGSRQGGASRFFFAQCCYVTRSVTSVVTVSAGDMIRTEAIHSLTSVGMLEGDTTVARKPRLLT